jgi:ethanolamine permease
MSESQRSGSEYLDKRQLKQGAAGWVLLAGLGVAYVISGDFAGWNIGLSEGGWGGLLIATILMALMYTCMVFALAEMSTMIPTAGGGYGFARRALGPLGGFMTGTAILIEYAIAPRRSPSSSAPTSTRSSGSAASRCTSRCTPCSSASTSTASARRSS